MAITTFKQQLRVRFERTSKSLNGTLRRLDISFQALAEELAEIHGYNVDDAFEDMIEIIAGAN